MQLNTVVYSPLVQLLSHFVLHYSYHKIRNFVLTNMIYSTDLKQIKDGQRF